MRSLRQKFGFLLILAALAIPLAVVSVAWACGHLVTLYVPSQARQGAAISGWGSGYNNAPTASPVTLHFNSRDGSVIWSGQPNAGGAIYPKFQVPHVKSGYYIILTEQTTPKGTPQVGTPGRAAIYIGKHRPRHARGSAVWLPTGTSSSGPGAAGAGLAVSSTTVLLATVLSGSLLGAGVVLLLGERRRRHQTPLVS